MKINLRSFVSTLTAVFAAQAGYSQTNSRPNIIWIIAEDMCPDLGCYGLKTVKTPNLDRLAAEGTRYTKAYATSPVCSPARSAFFTGMMQTSIGAHNHRSHMDDGYKLPDGVRPVSDYLHDAGYFTLLMGEKQKTDFNFYTPTNLFDATDEKKSVVMGVYAHGPVDESIFDGPAWKKYQGNQPFFAQINFSESHRTFTNDPEHPINPSDVEIPPYYPDHFITRCDWALYLETVQVLDKKVGKLVADLKERGLYDNSLILFIADQGRPMLRDKQWLYDGGIHVPLIVRWPGHVPAGKVSDELVSLIDLCPTSLSAAGVKPPPSMEGHTFIGPDKQPREYVFAARDRCDETVDRIRCVQDERFKYLCNYFPERPYTQFNSYKKLEYPVLTLMQILHREGKLNPVQELFFAPVRPAEELYDLENDPYEIHNLAADPLFSKTLLRMRAVLDDWIAKTGDQGAVPETPEVIKYWQTYFEKNYRDGMAKRGLTGASDEDYLAWWEARLIKMKNGTADTNPK